MYKQHFLIHLTHITDEDHNNWSNKMCVKYASLIKKNIFTEFLRIQFARKFTLINWYSLHYVLGI